MHDAKTQAWLDQEDERVAQTIRSHGVAIEYVLGNPAAKRTPIAYTIGLFGLGHPELLVTGADPHTAAALLNEVAGRVRAGENLVPGQVLTFEAWPHRVTVEEVPNPAQIVFGANRHARRPDECSVEVFALTYDDLGGRFPWEEGYAVAAWIQPRPGTFTA